jgi:cytochrome c-type biogenesis protein CcmE
MTPTGRRLAIGGAIVAAVMGYMAYLGGSASWQYYLTTDECLSQRTALGTHRIRVSGRVAHGSLCLGTDRREAKFALEGSYADVPVACATTAPDGLTEGMNVVVEGRLDEAGLLRGDKVLTRCASKYQSMQSAPPAALRAPGGGS